MTSLRGLVIIVSSFLCLLLVLVLIKILHKLWWAPARLQKLMASQGIKGPPYRLIHGNTKDISNMIKEAMSKPKSLSPSHEVLSVVQPHVHSWTKIYGKNYLQWHGSKAQLVITEPELCKEILNNKDKVYPKREPENFVKKLLGDGLVTTAEGEKWAKMRKLATQAFHGESLKSMIPAMVASAETMLERWKNYEGKEIEAFEEFRIFTSEVISRTAFGSSYIEGQHIFEMLMKLGFLFTKNSLTIRVPGISKLFKTGDEIESEKLEKDVRASILGIVRKEKRRKAEREVKLGKLIVPANVDLVMSCLSLHHDPLIWGQDAQLFKPERFAEGVAKASNNNAGAFLPFGVGPRTCVGLNFATIEAKIAVSMVLQRYSFTLSPGYVHLPFQQVTNRPLRGVQVMLHSL
ncbi:cytochrome P450 CYP749A22-like isoform X3 [Prunus yedoensis var. nudiflora]|uniref:Cytochrome P450 CYP749A22-like isoform X3 n=1 Tax=Prunus yedoensis var. nudiflora TaxID=2094558 RepID=A0A314YHD6_PRUYE|nr:cytochrome P450 CYP749A22-like isoform X3 [Prunus yedoensis var. nudiflora]